MTGLLQADAVALPLADDSVDLVVTSPPYFALRSYRDDGEHYGGQIGSEATPQEFLDALWTVTRECVRVLKPSGSLWVNLGDKYAEKSLIGLPWRYAIGCIDDLGLILRAEVVWSKPNGLPESVTDRVRRSHEQWFHFTLEPRYFSAIDEIREPHLTTGGITPDEARNDPRYAASSHRNIEVRNGTTKGATPKFAGNPLGKLPGSVWSIPSEPLKVPDELGVDHFAAFPQEWPRRLILGWCPAEVCTACGEGRAPVVEKRLRLRSQESGVARGPSRMNGRRGRNDEAGYPDGIHEATITGYACACPDTTAPSTPGVVLDPFAGTGTVPMVARALGRIGIGVDLSADYLRLVSWRVFQSGHASKTIARTNGERQGLLPL